MVENGSIVVVVAMIFTAAAGLVVGLVNAIASIVVAASRSRSRRASDGDVRKGVVVHVVFNGSTLCGYMPGCVPSDWPTGHKWTYLGSEVAPTCPGCRARAAEFDHQLTR
jgi:hypothetical protein